MIETSGEKPNQDIITETSSKNLAKDKLGERERRAKMFDSSPEGIRQKNILQKRREEAQKDHTLKPSEIGDWKTYEVNHMHVLVPGKYNDKQESLALGYSYNFKKGVISVWSTDERIRGLIEKTDYLGPVLISEHEDLLKEIKTAPPPRQNKK